MKLSIRRASLAFLLILTVLFQTTLLLIPASAEETAAVEPSRFFCDFFFAENGVAHYVSEGRVALPMGKDGKDISYSASVTPAIYDTPNNALRIVASNFSAADHFYIKYTYMHDGLLHTETQRINIGAYSVRCTYLVRTPHADSIVNLVLNLPASEGNSIVLHAMEAIHVWTPEEENEALGSVQSCIYNRNTKTVTVKGSVYHDVMIAARGGMLQLFRLESGQTVEELAADASAVPLAQSSISIGFQLQATAGDVAARFARYAVFILLPDGTRRPLATPQYARTAAESSASVSKRSDFKGIDTTLISGAIDSNVGSAIVDVYLNRLENDRDSGYLYIVDNEYFYFDRAYLAELDAQIRSLSGAACKVYLRFLHESDGRVITCAVSPEEAMAEGAEPEYLALRANDPDSLRHLYAYTSFLVSRYTDADSGAGNISGIIVGTRVDEAGKHHAAGDLILSDYVDLYGQTLNVISMTAKDIDPDLTMIVPVGDGWNADSIGYAHRRDCYTTELFAESLAAYLSHYGADSFTLMIESTHNPYGLNNVYFEPINTDGDVITEDMLPKLVAATQDSTYLSSENIMLLDTYLSRYAAAYDTLEEKYFYHWTPDEKTSGNALSTSYVYHYYRLFADSRANAFFVSFRGKEEAGNLTEFSKIKYLVKYIDTSAGSHRTSFALDVFGADRWQNLIPEFSRERTEHMILLEGTFVEPSADVVIGSYPLFDFATANSTRGWYAGNRCKSLSVVSSAEYGKTLDAVMQADMSALAEYADIAYRFETPLSLEHAPYLTLTFSVDCERDRDAVFEVKLAIGSDEGYMEAKQVVKNGETVTVSLNAAHFAEVSEIEYMRLSAKTVMGADEQFTLHVRSLSMDSREHDNASLKSLINEALRAPVIDVLGTNERSKDEGMLLLAASVAVVLFTVIGAAILTHHQKHNPESEE